MQGASLDHGLDLDDDDAAAGARCLRDGELLEQQSFLVQAQVAVLVGIGGADQRHVDARAGVEEAFLAVEFDQFDQVFAARLVEFAAFDARIDEGAQAHLREQARRARRDVAREVRERALREVVGLHLAGMHQRHHARAGLAEVAGHHAAHHAGMREVGHAALAAVADGATGPGGELARVAGGEEVALQPLQYLFGQAGHGDAAQEHGGAVADEGTDLVRGNDFHASIFLFFVYSGRSHGRHAKP